MLVKECSKHLLGKQRDRLLKTKFCLGLQTNLIKDCNYLNVFFSFLKEKIQKKGGLQFEFGVELSKFVLKILNIDEGLTAHLFDGSYNRSDCEFVMVGFYTSQVLDDFEIWYRHYMDFSPSLNKKSNVDGVLFLESGSDVYHGNSTAKCVFLFWKEETIFWFEAICSSSLDFGI